VQGTMLTPHDLRLHLLLRYLTPVVRPLLNYNTKKNLRDAVNIGDVRVCAESRLLKMCFGYLDCGSDDEVTLRRNKDAYSQLEMHYKVLSGLEPPLDLRTKIFGAEVKIPFFACPTAGNRMFHVQGELAVAKASKEFGSLSCLSSLSTTSLEEISTVLSPDHPKLFQLYIWKDRDLVKELMKKAQAKGFQSMALTVDFSWFGNRERDKRNQFSIPPEITLKQVWEAMKRPAWTWDYLSNPAYNYALIREDVPAMSLADFVNSQISPSFSWEDAKWLCRQWNGPKAIKGVCRPEDAKKAVDIGFDTIWVSNHGGRQLDSSPATVDVLESIRAAVGPEAHIILDGGVQRGSDIAKGLALGADGVGVGKPYLYGLAAGGEEGVKKVFSILRRELECTMGLLGVETMDQLQAEGPDLIRRRMPSLRDAQGARHSCGII